MKVCTDACLFGAWVASVIENNNSIQHILDIGTGTGLLSLMLAQKNKADIDAVEMNEAAALQAKENFNSAPWTGRLNAFNTTIENFEPGKKYDLIISNPPFFEDDLKSNNDSKNAAKHDTSLTLNALLKQVIRLLQPGGMAGILIPWQRTDYLENLIRANGFFINLKTGVKQSDSHGYFRSMLLFSKNYSETINEDISIHDAERRYSGSFAGLLKDYYLKL
jgi:tRNA1Val (adenine37-N6)-methyltransferase